MKVQPAESPDPVPESLPQQAPPLLWPPPLGAPFFADLARLMADPTQGETGPRAYAPMKQKRLFEQEFANLCGRRFGVAVNSGTTALDLAVEALELPRHAVVVAANYGHPATIRRAALTQRLRLIDVEPRSLSMCADALAEALRPGDVGLVLVTHFAGHAGRIHDIARICRTQSVPLVEDASHAHGAVFGGRRAGGIGDIGCFSLHATKNLSCGEGGILCLDDEVLYRRIWRLHDLGRDPEGLPYQFESGGGNFRLAEFPALEARHRLASLPEQLEQRNAAAKELIQGLDQDSCLQPVRGAEEDFAGWHILPMWYLPEHCGGMSRQRFVLSLSAAGVRCSTGWPSPLDQLPSFREVAEPQSTPVTNRACGEQVWVDGRLLLQQGGVGRLFNALARIKARRSR